MIFEFYVCSDVDETEEAVTKFALDTEQETLTKVSGFSGISHPSYMAFNSDKSMLYTVQGQDSPGTVTAIRVEPGAPEIATTDLAPEDLTESLPDTLTEVCTLPTGGEDPCHISVSDDDKFLFVSHYASGSLSVFTLNEEGIPEGEPQIIQDEGHGKDPVLQDGPHIRSAYVKEDQVYLVDTGLDVVDVYEPSEDEPGQWEDSGLEFKMPGGSGPCHLVFNDDYMYPEVYVLCAFSNQVLIWIKEHGTWRLADKWPTVSEEYEGENTAMTIKSNAYMVFASNKGDNSIAVYRIIDYGFLERTQIIKSGGETPKDIALLDRYLVAANEDSDLLSVFKINLKDRTIQATDMKAEVPKPVCVAGYRVPETPVDPKEVGEDEDVYDEEEEDADETGTAGEIEDNESSSSDADSDE